MQGDTNVPCLQYSISIVEEKDKYIFLFVNTELKYLKNGGRIFSFSDKGLIDKKMRIFTVTC
jgi:hypothetical protein